MKTVLKISIVLVSFLSALGIAELFYRLVLPVNTVAEYEEQLGTASITPPKHFTARKYQPKRPHPYIGYVYNDLLVDQINHEGFREQDQLPYKRNENEFVIGVFGGSFASDFAETQEFKQGQNETDFADRLRALDPKRFKNKKITVLNFGLASGRQPQQYIAISLFLESLDAVIAIDGFNEAYRNRDLDFPAYFPDYSAFFFSKDVDVQMHWAGLLKLREQQRALTRIVLNSEVLKKSQLVYQIWRGYRTFVDKRLDSLARAERPTEKFPADISLEDYNRQKASLWAKYARLQAHLLKGEKVPFIHVLQPNQHLPGTKPLSSEEKEKFTWKMNPNLESMLQTYMMILTEQKTLSKQGYKISDFTPLFKDHPETLYRDRCCHLNRTGQNLLEEALAEELVSALGRANY